MKRFFSLTSFAIFCCFVCTAQQEAITADSVVEHQQPAGRDGVPVFVNFSALVNNPGKVSLQWNVDHVAEGDYFIIERATDGDHYETIGAIRKERNTDHYELTDIAPPNGTDLYRIRYTDQDGRLLYSKTVQVSLSGLVDFKFYPNPVDKLLIIRTAHTVDIQMIDAFGVARLTRHLTAGIQVINISFLERGMYVLRVADKESNRIISNQLQKN